MHECLKCGAKNAAHSFEVMEVQTLHVRDLNGEKRVQALGQRQNYHICAACAKARQEQVFDIRNDVRKIIPFGILAAAGLVLAVVFWHTNGAFRLLGLGCLVGGLLALTATAQDRKKRRADYQAVTEEEALELAAWDVLLASAPKKDGENDLSYIPINETTLARKEGDLMILYDLLPAIARQCYRRIHGIPEDD